MPKYAEKRSWFSRSEGKGDLYIKLDIEFPSDNWYLEKNDLLTIKNILPTNLKGEYQRYQYQRQMLSFY